MNVCFAAYLSALAQMPCNISSAALSTQESQASWVLAGLSNHHRHYIGVDAFLTVLNVHRAHDA
jgi:hypothetical protein